MSDRSWIILAFCLVSCGAGIMIAASVTLMLGGFR